MKLYTIILFNLIMLQTFGQVDEINDFAVTVNRVEEMAIFPGCEEYEGSKKQLFSCFGNKMFDGILRYLDTEYPDLDKPSKQVAVLLQYSVTTDGTIAEVKAVKGDKAFEAKAINAVERFADYLVRKNKTITPARMADGSRATLIFNQPVTLRNPNYDDSDWIIYYYKKNFSIDGIYENLKDKEINQFNKRQIKEIIRKYNKR